MYTAHTPMEGSVCMYKLTARESYSTESTLQHNQILQTLNTHAYIRRNLTHWLHLTLCVIMVYVKCMLQWQPIVTYLHSTTHASVNHGRQCDACVRDVSHTTTTAKEVWNDDDDEKAGQLIHQLGFGFVWIFYFPKQWKRKMKYDWVLESVTHTHFGSDLTPHTSSSLFTKHSTPNPLSILARSLDKQ